MIRINLLPIRQLKKRARARKQMTGMVLLLFIVLALLAATGFIQAKKITDLNQEIAALNNEKETYSPTLKRIEKLKKDKKELVRKTDIIKKLKTDSSLTVRVLDEVANKIDNQRMWLSSLQQQNNSLTLTGVALDNQTIAQFMDNLKESQFVKEVSLTNSSLKVISGRNLKSFSLSCNVSQPEKARSDQTATADKI